MGRRAVDHPSISRLTAGAGHPPSEETPAPQAHRLPQTCRPPANTTSHPPVRLTRKPDRAQTSPSALTTHHPPSHSLPTPSGGLQSERAAFFQPPPDAEPLTTGRAGGGAPPGGPWAHAPGPSRLIDARLTPNTRQAGLNKHHRGRKGTRSAPSCVLSEAPVSEYVHASMSD